MKKFVLFPALFLLLSLTACDGSAKDQANSDGAGELLVSEEVASSKGQQQVDRSTDEGQTQNPPNLDGQEPDTPVSSDGNAASPPLNYDTGNQQISPSSEEIKYITEQGTYTGMIDANSIEIMTDEGPLALRIHEVKDVNFEETESDISVTFQYFKADNGQNILIRIIED